MSDYIKREDVLSLLLGCVLKDDVNYKQVVCAVEGLPVVDIDDETYEAIKWFKETLENVNGALRSGKEQEC